MSAKRVVIITSNKADTSIDWTERQRYVHEFYQGVQDGLDNTQVLYATYADITVSVVDGKLVVRDERHDVDLSNVHLVHFKNWLFDYEHACVIAFYLRRQAVRFYNEEVDAGLAWGKISQMCRLAVEGVPVPNTFFAKNIQLQALVRADRLPKVFAYPLILKADNGSKGANNHLVKDKNELLAILAANPQRDYVVQVYVPNEGDYRFLFAGTEQLPLVFLRRGTPGSHLNNTSQGGVGSFVDPQSLPSDYISIARNAARVLKREISGVDIMVDKDTGRLYVLEVNSTPALATGYGIDQKMKLFTELIKHDLEEMEEE